MRSESDPRRRIAWQPETPMSKALWENGSRHEAIISTTGPKSLEGRRSGIKARAGIISILGMLLEPGEPAQASFGGHHRGRTSPAQEATAHGLRGADAEALLGQRFGRDAA